ncbi:CorA metal ion transporter [Coemansia sp. RSA 1933]|nr:CorA metal ion transporter [Coemansia sp. RSA 1933]
MSDIIANQYYGNMDVLRETANRLPRPINSTLPLFSPSVISGHNGALDVSIDIPPDSQDDALESLRRASTGSLRTKEGEDKICSLNLLLDSRPSSQTRFRRNKDMGTTQYKPANATGKSAVARGAPGLSYMFSPQISASRPSSVIGVVGVTTPSQQQQHQQQHQHAPSVSRLAEGFLAEPSRQVPSPVCSPNETKTPTPTDDSQEGATQNTTGNPDRGVRIAPEAGTEAEANVFAQPPDRKLYSSINIEALERFLDEGEIPTSSSDDELSDDDDGEFGWGEDYVVSEPSSSRYNSHRSSYSSAQRIGAGLQQSYIPQTSYPWRKQKRLGGIDPISAKKTSPSRGLGISSPLQASTQNQYPPFLQDADGQLIADDEQTPLLRSKDSPAPPQYSNESARFIVPADVLNMNSFDCRYPSTQNSTGMDNVAMLERQMRRARRNRREHRRHEELFIDKNGFIDESYRFTFFNPEIGTIRAQEFADLRTPTMDLAELLQAGGCFWIDVFRPSLQEMHLISKVFRIHALNVEDIMTQDSREKCEIHANYYFVCFRSFDNNHNSDAYLEPKCIYNVVLREGIVTFHMEPSVHQYHVLRRIRRQIDHIVVTPDWLNYAIIDDITDLLAPVMQVIEFEVDAIDELVLVISSSEQSDMLLRISNVRKKIMMLMRLLHGKADVVRALIKRFESATAISASQMNAMAGSTAAERATASGAGAASTWGDSPRHRSGGGGNNDSMWTYSTEAPDPAMEVALDQRKGHETILYLGDVLDHILTMLQNAAHYDSMLSRAQANYLAQISIELTASSNRTNDVVAKLSALAAIVVPLNFITGMWGANVKVPGQDYDDLHYFFTILGMCMLYVVAAVCWARYCKIF